MFPKKIRVVSDGTKRDTHIYDADTGEELSRVTSVSFEHEAGSVPMVKLTLLYIGTQQLELDLVVHSNDMLDISRQCDEGLVMLPCAEPTLAS